MNELLIQTILESIYDGDDSYRDVAEACARDIQIALSTPKGDATRPDTKEMLIFVGVRKVLSTLAEMLLHFDKEESNRLLDGLLREVQCLRDRRSASVDSTNAAQNSMRTERFGTYVPPTRGRRAEAIALRMESFPTTAVWDRSLLP